jgi:hypothetical protein
MCPSVSVYSKLKSRPKLRTEMIQTSKETKEPPKPKVKAHKRVLVAKEIISNSDAKSDSLDKAIPVSLIANFGVHKFNSRLVQRRTLLDISHILFWGTLKTIRSLKSFMLVNIPKKM